MTESVVGIHPLHRHLAKITHMSMDRHGNLIIGAAEMRMIMPLLKQNLEMITQLDYLKQLSFHAYEMGDQDWQMDICAKIEELEGQLEI